MIYVHTQNTYYLQWWLTIQLVLTIVGVAVFVCYSHLYDKDVYITNLLAVGKLQKMEFHFSNLYQKFNYLYLCSLASHVICVRGTLFI